MNSVGFFTSDNALVSGLVQSKAVNGLHSATAVVVACSVGTVTLSLTVTRDSIAFGHIVHS